MSFLYVFKNVNKIPDSVVAFTTSENMTEFPYPSIILFKGTSSKYGKGYAILVDYENVLDFWSEEWLDDENILDLSWDIMEITKVYYRPKKISIPSNWEEFYNFLELFIQNNEIIILKEQFEKKEEQNLKTIEILDFSMEIMDAIRDTLSDFFISDELLYNIEIKSSGKVLIFSIDLKKYINMANMLETEMEKKLLWLIIRITMEKSIFNNFKELNPKVVSNGIIKIELDKININNIREKFNKLKKDLYITSEDAYNTFNELKEKTTLINDLKDLKNIFEKESEKDFIEILDILIIDTIINKNESIIEKIKKVSKYF